jgi:hypothetical protein
LATRKGYKIKSFSLFYRGSAILPVGDATARLEEGGNKDSCLHGNSGKRWQGTAATQKINSIAMLAGLYFFVVQCGGGYLYIMCLIGFFFRACLHKPG